MKFIALIAAALIAGVSAQDTTSVSAPAPIDPTTSAAAVDSTASAATTATSAVDSAAVTATSIPPVIASSTTTTKAALPTIPTVPTVPSSAVPDKYKSCNQEAVGLCIVSFIGDVAKISGCSINTFTSSNSSSLPACACPAAQTLYDCVKKANCQPAADDIVKESAPTCSIKTTSGAEKVVFSYAVAAAGVAGLFAALI
ncbi:hypothetical protein HDU97_007795 [Phlyctochytrium planicorne]|nr:hypothetical protein HDU97_007795 [Phlyctochytrium planicorne]